MKLEGYDLVITEEEMRVLADHRREELKKKLNLKKKRKKGKKDLRTKTPWR